MISWNLRWSNINFSETSVVDVYGRNVEVITLLNTIKPLLNTMCLWGKDIWEQNKTWISRTVPIHQIEVHFAPNEVENFDSAPKAEGCRNWLGILLVMRDGWKIIQLYPIYAKHHVEDFPMPMVAWIFRLAMLELMSKCRLPWGHLRFLHRWSNLGMENHCLLI